MSIGMCGMEGACVHINTFLDSPHTHSKSVSAEGKCPLLIINFGTCWLKWFLILGNGHHACMPQTRVDYRCRMNIELLPQIIWQTSNFFFCVKFQEYSKLGENIDYILTRIERVGYAQGYVSYPQSTHPCIHTWLQLAPSAGKLPAPQEPCSIVPCSAAWTLTAPEPYVPVQPARWHKDKRIINLHSYNIMVEKIWHQLFI